MKKLFSNYNMIKANCVIDDGTWNNKLPDCLYIKK
jgi:hypothetical protein